MKRLIKNPIITGLSILILGIMLSGCAPYGPYYYNAYYAPYSNNPGYYGYYHGPVYSTTYVTPGYYVPSYYGTGWSISPSFGVGVGF